MPHAAHCAPSTRWRDARLAVINLGRDLEVSSTTADEWLATMILKAGKTDRLDPASFRPITLGHARARIVDELRMQRLEPLA